MELMKPGMTEKTVEQHKIDSGEAVNQPDAAINAASAAVDSEEAKETALNEPPAQAQEPTEKPEQTDGVKHHLTFLGHGIWTDAVGQYWHRNEGKGGCITHKLMGDAELQARPDIKFMIKYGAIKDVIVE